MTDPYPQPSTLTTEQQSKNDYLTTPEDEAHQSSPLNESVNLQRSVVGLDEFPSCISQSDISYHREQHICLRREELTLTEAQVPTVEIPPPPNTTSKVPSIEAQEDLLDNWADLLGDSKPTSARQIATQGLNQQEENILQTNVQKKNKSLLGAFFSEDFPNQFSDEYGSVNHSNEKGAPQPLLMDLMVDKSPEPALNEKPYEAPLVNLEKDKENQQAENSGTKQASNVIVDRGQPNEGEKFSEKEI